MGFKLYKQRDSMDCGPACLRMIAKFYGRNIQLKDINRYSNTDKQGASMLGISEAAEKNGFKSLGARVKLTQLQEVDLPCILHWRQYHFVVLYKIKNNKYYLADPASGLFVLDREEFKRNWLFDSNTDSGVALLLSPSQDFFDHEDENDGGIQWWFLIRNLSNYRKLLLQLFIGLGIGAILQLLAPLLTQSIIDIGINTRNLSFVSVIIVAQGALILGKLSVEFMRSWILLHITTRVNINVLTDFLIKLMKLPISFFDSRMTGDIMQRMNDQKKIEAFLTGPLFTSIFSVFNFVVFTFVLALYNVSILSIFIISNTVYICWILLFLKRRRALNYKSFEVSANNQGNLIQMVNGMQEIKLNNCEKQKRWEWEHIQARLFRFNSKSLVLSQFQQGGASLINEGSNLLITFFCARAVINGSLSLGAMVAVQYIAGQLNGPIQQLLGFAQSFQDAKISMERLNEIHQMDDEEMRDEELLHELPEDKSILFHNVTFRYPSSSGGVVLQNLEFQIPQGKTTAIVGTSGSGKTTILKLLLRFYRPQTGDIKLGDVAIDNVSLKVWRSQCGAVMQDGFIFSDSIAKNIAVGEDNPDTTKLKHAIKIANIQGLVDNLPQGVNTKIGSEGKGISQGQRQRILIARAVYKNPHYIFFDEATNSLDSNNEQVIMDNLYQFFAGRTVVIVAHRLSTITNADNIILLNEGQIAEQGTHSELFSMGGQYYELVKNQVKKEYYE